jgi:MOB kinase activator 1
MLTFITNIYEDVIRLKEEIHLNTSFKHFILFVQEFKLVDAKELAPLDELIERIVGSQ